MNIVEKLMNIQQKLNAPKDQFNSFGKYSYRSAEGILQAVKPLLEENKVCLTLSDTMCEIGGRVYVKATATLKDAESTEDIFVDAFAREEESKKGMDASQVTGASSSYARKYALNGLFAIDDNKDSDATNTGEKPPKFESKPQDAEIPAQPQKNQQSAGKQPKEAPDGYYYCESCGGIITEFSSKGKTISQKEFAANTLNRYGKQLCKDCATKAKNEGKTS